jgi:hypothetical protein
MQGKVRSARMLGREAALAWSPADAGTGGVVITLPSRNPEDVVPIVRLELDGPVQPIVPTPDGEPSKRSDGAAP